MQNAIQIASIMMLAGVAQANLFNYADCQRTAANHASDLAIWLTNPVDNNHFTYGFAKPHYNSLSSACNSFVDHFNSAPEDCLSEDFANVFNGFDQHLSDVLQHFCDNADAIGGHDYARQCGNDLWWWYGDIASKWGSIADCEYVDFVWEKHCALTDAFSHFFDFFDCGHWGFNWGDCGAFDHHTSQCKLSTSSAPLPTHKSSASSSSPKSEPAQSTPKSSPSPSKSTPASSTPKPTGSASSVVVSTYSDPTTSYRCRVVGSAAGGLA